MDQKTLPKLPMINFTNQNLKPNTRSWFSACKDVQNALDEYGTFIAVYDDDISLLQVIRAKIKKMMGELFDLSMQIKVQNTSDHPFCGYTGQIPEIPLFEGLGIEDATSLKKIESFCKVMWADDGYNKFSEIIQEYTKLVVELEQKVSKMVFESYGIDDGKLINNHISSKMYMLRFNRYNVPEPHETKLGAHIHTDKSFITILDQINEVNALEVKLKDGQWINVDFLPSSFVVMAGEGMLAWSNGRVQPVIHRVKMNGNEKRFSMGLFSYQKGILEIPQVLIDEDHPQCYKPFDHLGLLTFYADQQNKIWKNSESTIKDYCGV